MYDALSEEPYAAHSRQGESIDDEWLVENKPEVGGLYSVDEEGTASYIPAEVFEKNFREA